MRYFLQSITLMLLVAACTPNSMENNTHQEAPIYERSARVETQEVESLAQVEQLYTQLRPAIDSENTDRLLSALEAMEVYLLNLENLSNPVINTRGSLHPAYTRLMNLYGLGMSIAIRTVPANPRLAKLLDNYRLTVFHSCHLDNMDCQTAAAFKGPYGVSILSHLIRQDIQSMENATQTKFSNQELKNVIFSLYVLKNFDESQSNITQSLFIDFSSIFFRSVDIANIEDALLNKFLLDLQNMMVYLAAQDAAPATCSIFQSLDRHQLNHITETLDRSFVVQFNNHYYRCHSSEQIIDRIVADEEDLRQQAIQEVENKGAWSEFRNNIHARTFVLKENHADVLATFNIQSDIPLSVLHVMDQIYYGRMDVTEQEALLERLSEQDLETFVRMSEQYAQMNYLYAMQYTFNQFNNALTASFESNQTINKKFVQDVYDALWQSTGDMWLDYRRRISRLRQGVSDVYFKLSVQKREELESLYDDLNEKKLEDTSVTNLINVGVTYPIVLATTYFTGVDGGGTMEIRVSWLRGANNTIEISTIKPLRDYFRAYTRNILQLLDFGTIGYQPYRLERSYGLAAAIKSGFFDTVNLDLGNENKGMEHNLKLFWERYVENNRQYAEIAQREIEELRKVEENHWPKVQRMCNFPISGARRIEMRELYQDFYLDSRESSSSVGTRDLEYATRINSIQNKIDVLRTEIKKMRRTYQVILTALQEKGAPINEIKTQFQAELVPHFQTMKTLISKREKLQADVQKQDESCLYTLNQMQRFQQNIMQKKAVDYASRVHAAMSYAVPTSSLFRRASEMNSVEDIQALFEAEKARLQSEDQADTYSLWVCDQILNTSVVETVASDLGYRGQALLTEALNLIVSPHNLDADFGVVVKGMSVRAQSLNDPNSFLTRRGGFDSEYFEISDQDQRLRVREELKGLTARAGDLHQYFSQSPTVLAELKNAGYDADSASDASMQIPLNPNMDIFINNFQYFKDKLGSTEKRSRVRYTTDRLAFVQETLEKLFGNNQEGQQIFNWSSQYSKIEYLSSNYSTNLETYLGGPIFLPENLDTENPQLSCVLDASFDDMDQKEGCQSYAIEAKQIIDEFLQRAEFFYLEKDELAPMLTENSNGSLDELSSILDATLLTSEYIDQYKPSSILSYFRYYKKKTEPEEWTWFDQFLAKEFTTVQARDNQFQSLNVPLIPGTRNYEVFFEEAEHLETENLLIPFNSSTHSIFRNWFRSEIFNFIRLTDSVIEEMVRREYEAQASDFPAIKFRREDVADISANDSAGREWLELPIKTRSNGSLVLLEDYGYETKVYEDQQKVVLEEFECSLMPKMGDLDFDPAAESYINEGYNCEAKVRRWLNYKKCEQVKSRKQKYQDYHKSCVNSLGGQ